MRKGEFFMTKVEQAAKNLQDCVKKVDAAAKKLVIEAKAAAKAAPAKKPAAKKPAAKKPAAKPVVKK